MLGTCNLKAEPLASDSLVEMQIQKKSSSRRLRFLLVTKHNAGGVIKILRGLFISLLRGNTLTVF
jgi:hypothetical protein